MKFRSTSVQVVPAVPTTPTAPAMIAAPTAFETKTKKRKASTALLDPNDTFALQTMNSVQLTVINGAIVSGASLLTDDPSNLKSSTAQKLLIQVVRTVPLTYMDICKFAEVQFKLATDHDLDWDRFHLMRSTPTTRQYRENPRAMMRSVFVLEPLKPTYTKDSPGRLVVVVAAKNGPDTSLTAAGGSATGKDAVYQSVIGSFSQRARVDIAAHKVPDYLAGVEFDGVSGKKQEAAVELIRTIANRFIPIEEVTSYEAFLKHFPRKLQSCIQGRKLDVDELPTGVYYKALSSASSRKSSTSHADIDGETVGHRNRVQQQSSSSSSGANDCVKPAALAQAEFLDPSPQFIVRTEGNQEHLQINLSTLQAVVKEGTKLEIMIAKSGLKFTRGDFFSLRQIIANNPDDPRFDQTFIVACVEEHREGSGKVKAMPWDKFEVPALVPDFEVDATDALSVDHD